MQKQQAELAQSVAGIDASISRVAVAEENFVSGVGTDFAAFVARASHISAQVDRAQARREVALANAIRSRLQDEMQEVNEYLLVARIAVARATDQLAELAGVEVEAASNAHAGAEAGP